MSTIQVPLSISSPGSIPMTVGVSAARLPMTVKTTDRPAVPMTVTGPRTVGLTVGTQTKTFNFEITAKTVIIGAGGQYPGPYTVTPTRSTQTLATYGQTMGANVTINPIPPEYGLVSYDGAVMTIT